MTEPFECRRGNRRLLGTITFLFSALCALLPGCGSQTSGAGVVATSLPTLTPLPTVQVRYLVEVTPFALPTPKRHLVVPRPTLFVPPSGPYLELSPRSGPPTTRTIQIHGGNLPPSSEIALVWSAGGRSSSLSTTTYTNKKGALSAQFEVPGSPPGRYRIVAEASGVPYTTASYRVTSAAVLTVTTQPVRGGEEVHVRGRKFLPTVQFFLVVYPTFRGARPVALGKSRANRYGGLYFTAKHVKLSPGQYVLHAWPASSVAAQTAETAFEVVI